MASHFTQSKSWSPYSAYKAPAWTAQPFIWLIYCLFPPRLFQFSYTGLFTVPQTCPISYTPNLGPLCWVFPSSEMLFLQPSAWLTISFKSFWKSYSLRGIIHNIQVSTNKWIEKQNVCVYTHTHTHTHRVEYYLSMKRIKVLIHTKTWMSLILLRSQTQKDK